MANPLRFTSFTVGQNNTSLNDDGIEKTDEKVPIELEDKSEKSFAHNFSFCGLRRRARESISLYTRA